MSNPALNQTPKLTGDSRQYQAESLTQRAYRRFRRHRLAMIAVVILGIIMVLAVVAPLVQRYDYGQIDLNARSEGPSAAHWLGTDRTGRDIWSRTIHGGRISLLVGILSTLISTSIGLLLGAVSGYYGGVIDMLVMRFTDIVMTFPSIIIMLTFAALLPRTAFSIIAVIGLLSWPKVARLVRGQFLTLREQDFITAAHCLGVRDRRIIVAHVLPNVFAPLVALVTFSVGEAILIEAGLSFLGLGVPPPTPSWGNMLESARNLQILQELPWMWVPPAIMTVLTVLCINFIGDGIRDAIDPRLVM